MVWTKARRILGHPLGGPLVVFGSEFLDVLGVHEWWEHRCQDPREDGVGRRQRERHLIIRRRFD